MIIAIDGYDGTGKTILAKRLASEFGFIYIEKPLDYMIQSKYHCSLSQARHISAQLNDQIFKTNNKQTIAKFYCDVLLWLKKYEKKSNIVLDRGFLSTYAVVGFPETKKIFEEYLDRGIFFDSSIYLKATDEERIRRIRERDPNDPDLKYPTKWHKNDLEEFACSKHLNFHIIDTNNKSPDQVYYEAKSIFVSELNKMSSEIDFSK